MMQCYFYAPPTGNAELRENYEKIRKVLDRPDVFLSTNLDKDIRIDTEVLAASREADAPVLERMDTFVIEGTQSDADIGYLLAHAIALKKQTLYLYQRGTVAKVFSHLSQKELPPWIHVVSYQGPTVEKKVEEFLVATGGKAIKPVPRIKFTLRITGMIERYLHYKTHNTKVSKADYLREEIEKMMDNDREWQQYLQKHRGELLGTNAGVDEE